MKKLKTFVITFTVALLLLSALPQQLFVSTPVNVEAHSGRTDSSGGHRDNKNASGLGYYHYHCGGHPAHLHTNGYCPYSVTVEEPETEVKPAPQINKTTVTVKSGKTTTLKLSNASGTIKWRSSNKKVASVDSEGNVSAKSAGTCTITATYERKTYSCKITVKNPFKLQTKSLVLQVGEQAYIESNIRAGLITWSSNKPEIATVTKRGKVKAKAVGRCTIYAKYYGKTLKCKVVVKRPLLSGYASRGFVRKRNPYNSTYIRNCFSE